MAKKIILVHGLGGTADKTWGNFQDFLNADIDVEYEAISCGYQSPNLFNLFAIFERSPGILNIANGVLTDIRARCDLERDDIILAGHSLGGIIVKKIMLILKNRRIDHNISKVCFFDVPHDGSGYANAGKYVHFRNRHLKSLVRDSSELDDLNDQWEHSGLNDSLDIISIIAANDDIVSSSSSKSIFRGHSVETINDVDHSSIVKPESTNSTAYIVFKKFILKKNTVARYRNISSRDIEDWKNVERNHSYHYVSDETRDSHFASIISALEMDRAVIRLTGASGLGKTRTLLEAIEASGSIDDTCVLVFNAPGYETVIRESIRAMVEDLVHGLAIIENCSVELHNYLAREVNKQDCHLKVITVGYSDAQVDDSIHIQLSPLSNDAIKQVLTPILVDMDATDIERVARFAQGYPLMATLIAEQYQNEGRLLGSIESTSVVRKLIDGDGGISRDEEEVLAACSLFDVFGTSEGPAGEEARFIAEDVAGSDLKVFDRVIKTFTGRQIINRAGRYARLVPKPLALTLASEWWSETSYDRQKQLIDSLPESLIQSFCTQAAYLDSQESVQRFSDRLFGGQSPFVQAEGLLTDKGSKLFRAFVEVNPGSTCDALYRVLSTLGHDELMDVDGETRRNIIWGLEKLSFRSEFFEKSAWCLLLFASAENEGWSNNATGMFAQLFRVRLSGTQAIPKVRFDLLNRAINLGNEAIDMVVIAALDEAISTYGGTRTIGAEYQGTGAPLEEWQPEKWQEIYDFWQQSFDLLLVLLDRGGAQKDKVISTVGHSIRSFVAQGRMEMLDDAIRTVITSNGRYWPEALDSIKTTIQYDSKEMDQSTIEVLHRWLDLLDPKNADVPERLKILVTNPPWEHKEDSNGRYVDVAADNAKALATELVNSISELTPHLDLLLEGPQKQSYSFGYQLALELEDLQPLLELTLARLADIEHPDIRLVLGLFRGLFERSTSHWQANLDALLESDQLTFLYPEVMRTGDIQEMHLDKLLELIKHGLLSSQSANSLSYGSVTNGIEPEVMAKFCLGLAEIDDEASWSSLSVIYMYYFGQKESIQLIRNQLKQLVLSVPLHKEHNSVTTDFHHWHDLSSKLMAVRDESFAIRLSKQLIEATSVGLEHGPISSYIKPLMHDLMREYWQQIWPLFGSAIADAQGMELYWLQQLLNRENSLSSNSPSVFCDLPVDTVIDWCRTLPDLAPVFVARCLNVIETVEEQRRPSELFIALLEAFGDDHDVGAELSANMGTRGWSGSLVPYLESDKEVLCPLLDHGNANVRHWVKDHIIHIDKQIIAESMRDEEHNLGLY